MTLYDPHNDPYAFVRERAAQLFAEGDLKGTRMLLDVVDKAQMKLLRKSKKSRKHKKHSKRD